MAESGTPLLGTKFVVPPVRLPLVPRPRLLERLQESLNYSFVLVSASAGSGKTTMLSDWARHPNPKIPIAWLSLDQADNDPVRFWDYVLAALKTLQPTFGESTLSVLRSGQQLRAESLLTVLINELTLLSYPLVLILDDYHLIMARPLHDAITYLIEYMPSQMHLVIATRVDPPLPLAHFRGKGMMLEIRADDLRFSRDEAVALFKAMKTRGLSDEDAGKLESHTQGWAVGLKMSALAIQRQPDMTAFIAGFTGSQRYVMDYLVEEVLERQSGEVRDFLLKTSVLERLTAPLCDALTGLSDSHALLKELERANLFIAPLNESREWYRYDHLFLDLLRHQLEVTFGAGHIDELHRRASRWYEENSLPDEAIDHALEAKDWGTAIRLLHDHQTEKLRIGESVTVLNWLRRLPDEVRDRDRQTCVYYGNLLLEHGHIDAAEAVADHLNKVAGDDNRARGAVASLRSRTALAKGDTNRAFEMGKQALSLFPKGALDGRAVLSLSLGSHLWMRGQFKDAQPWLTEAYEAARKAGHHVVAAHSLALLAAADQTVTGRLRLAAERYREAIELVGPNPGAASSHQSLGWILYELNDIDAAVREVGRALELGRLAGMRIFVARQHCLLAQCRLAQGNEVAAVKELGEACLIAHGSAGAGARAEHAAYHITMALLQHDLASALEWGRRLAEDAVAMPFFLSHVPPRLLIAQGEKARASERLRAMSEETAKGIAHHHIVFLRLYQALAADNTESALGFLADVLAMTEPEGYIRTFVDEGRLLAPLLRQAIARGISPDYSARLLSIIEAEERRKQKPKDGGTLLSKRELEILGLLASEISNQLIAQRLYISTGTVKIHVHNILEKLGVRDRSQAVTRAKQINLI